MNLTSLSNSKSKQKLNINRFFKFKKPYASNFLVVGHRGARGLASENTIASFEKAIELEVDSIELDVVISKDHQVVVSHEAWMNPLTCLSKEGKRISEDQARLLNLYQMDYDEIKQYDCGSLRHPLFDEQETEESSKPLLRDALFMMEFISKNHQQEISYTIELKSASITDGLFHPSPSTFVDLVMESIAEFPSKRINLRSFDVRILKVIKDKYPAYSTCLISADGKINKEINSLGFIPEIYSPNYRLLTKSLIKKCRRKKIQIIPWTVNEFEDLRNLLLMNVDGVITDFPNRALRLRNRLKKIES